MNDAIKEMEDKAFREIEGSGDLMRELEGEEF